MNTVFKKGTKNMKILEKESNVRKEDEYYRKRYFPNLSDENYPIKKIIDDLEEKYSVLRAKSYGDYLAVSQYYSNAYERALKNITINREMMNDIENFFQEILDKYNKTLDLASLDDELLTGFEKTGIKDFFKNKIDYVLDVLEITRQIHKHVVFSDNMSYKEIIHLKEEIIFEIL